MSLAKTKKESPQAKLCFLYNLHKEKKPGRGVRSERIYRAVERSENPGTGASRNVVGITCPPLVEIGLTDVPKFGWAIALLALRFRQL